MDSIISRGPSQKGNGPSKRGPKKQQHINQQQHHHHHHIRHVEMMKVRAQILAGEYLIDSRQIASILIEENILSEF